MTSQTPYPGQSPILITPIKPKTHPLAIFSSVIASISSAGVLVGFSTIAIELVKGAYAFGVNSPTYAILFLATAVTILPAFAGIIVGHIGLHRITKNAGQYKGEQQATVSLIICYFSLSMAIVNVIVEVIIAIYLAARSI